MIDDLPDRAVAQQRTDATADVIYPPPWYLDLVRGRLEVVRWALGSGAVGLWSGAEPAAPGDDAGLLALAEEILGLESLDALPFPAKRYVLGVDDEEVRRYVADVAAQLRARSPTSACA